MSRRREFQSYAECIHAGYIVSCGRLIDALRLALIARRWFRVQSGTDTAYTNDGTPFPVKRSPYVWNERNAMTIRQRIFWTNLRDLASLVGFFAVLVAGLELLR